MSEIVDCSRGLNPCCTQLVARMKGQRAFRLSLSSCGLSLRALSLAEGSADLALMQDFEILAASNGNRSTPGLVVILDFRVARPKSPTIYPFPSVGKPWKPTGRESWPTGPWPATTRTLRRLTHRTCTPLTGAGEWDGAVTRIIPPRLAWGSLPVRTPSCQEGRSG